MSSMPVVGNCESIGRAGEDENGNGTDGLDNGGGEERDCICGEGKSGAGGGVGA